MEQTLKMIATLCAALFTGGALYISIVEHPARMADIGSAVQEFRNSYKRAAPWQASTAIICFLATLPLSIMTDQWLWACGGVALGAVVPFTLIVIRPTNERLFEARDIPGDEARSLLEKWGKLHWVRSALGALGLITLLVKDCL